MVTDIVNALLWPRCCARSIYKHIPPYCWLSCQIC